MPGTYLGFPFDEELFMLQWQNAVDPTRTALLSSGAIVQSSEIRNLIANGGNLYTIPFYNVLGGDEECSTSTLVLTRCNRLLLRLRSTGRRSLRLP